MGNEAASRPAIGPTPVEYVFETIDTMTPVISAIRDITTQGIEHIALVTIALNFEQSGRASSKQDAFSGYSGYGGCNTYSEPCSTTVALMTELRRKVRRTDFVYLLGDSMYFLLLGSNVQGGQIVQTRLWDALLWRIHNMTESELMRPQSLTIGHSAYPEPYSDVAEFLTAASQPAIRFELVSEKQNRKMLAQQARSAQQQAETDELTLLARKLGIPYLSLLPRRPRQRVQQLVDPRLAQELRCYPLGRERNMLTVALSDPQDQSVLERLQQETGLNIFPVLTNPQELQTALEQLL